MFDRSYLIILYMYIPYKCNDILALVSSYLQTYNQKHASRHFQESSKINIAAKPLEWPSWKAVLDS